MLLLIFAIMSLAAQNFETQLNLQYKQKLDYKREVYTRTLETIRDNPNSGELDQLYFNLAELSTEIDQTEPDKTVSYYRQILRYNRDFIYKDIVLYNIAYYTEKSIILKKGKQRQIFQTSGEALPDTLKYSEKMFKPATDFYKRLLEEHPLSAYYDETAWRLAELYYKIGIESNNKITLLRASDNFRLITSKTESPFYYQCLIGDAWTAFELANYSDAFSNSINLLIGLNNSSNIINRRILTDDAISIIAGVLINDGNINFSDVNVAIAQIQLKLRELPGDYWEKSIVFTIGKQFLLEDKPLKAISVLEAYLTYYPASENAPEIDAAIIDIYKKYPAFFGGEENVTAIIEQRYDQMLTSYNPESLWYLQNKGLDIFKSVEIIRSLIEFKEPEIYNEFINTPDLVHYLKYYELITSYSGFLDFPSLPAVQKEKAYRHNLVYLSQMLAQTTEAPADYEYAIRALENFNSTYPDNPDYYDFAMNIFFCYEKLYSTSGDYLLESSDSLYISASLQYENILRQDPLWENRQDELARVIFKRAEHYLSRGNFESALLDYQAITTLETDKELITDSWRRSAEIALQKKNFTRAEADFRQAMSTAAGFTQSLVFDNILATIQQKAEYLLSTNKPDAAAAEYLRLSAELEAVYPDKSLQFFSQAIDVYEELGNDKKVNELLTLSSQKQNLDQTIALYLNTWQETDRLKDWNRSIALRNTFINRYPGTSEAFRTKLQIIDIYENQLLEKETAAQLYLDLYREADKYDLGSQRPENIYLNALRIYQNLQDVPKCAELTTDFTLKYPDYSLIDLNLTYNDSDNYRTRLRKLQKLKDNINSLFLAEEYEAMANEIKSFQEISTALNADSLLIDLARDNALYDNFLKFADFYKRFKNALDSVENRFLLQNTRELLPVDKATRWQENMVAGENRIDSLLIKCDRLRNDIIALLQEGKSYQLDTPDYTHAIWAIAVAYDHAYEITDQQIRNFVVISDQLNRPELKDNKYLQSELKRKVIAEGNDYSFQFKLAAATFYQNLLYNYSDNIDYSDLWTRKALTRLKEWGIRDIAGEIVALDDKTLLAEESYADEEIEKQYNNIYSDYQAKRYALAQEQFMSFINSYPGHSLSYEALYYAGESYFNMGQLSKARDIFEQVLDFDRDKTPDALLRLGHYYNSVGNRREAFTYWNRLINEYPDHYLTQIVKLTLSQIEEQGKIAEQISSRDVSEERSIELKYRKNVQYYQKGKFKAAWKGFAKFCRLYPEHELAYNSRFMQAEALYKEEKFSDAALIYEQVIALEGNKTALACYHAGLCAEKSGNTGKRDTYWLKLITEFPDHYLVNLITSGNQELALQVPALATSPPRTVKALPAQIQAPVDKAQYQYKKALMKFRYQDYANAIISLETFISENPEHRLAYNARFLAAEAYEYTGDNSKALSYFNELLPQSGARRAETLIHIAENNLAMGNYQEAKEVLNSIIISYAGTFSAAQARNMLQQIPSEVIDEN